jgi:hypothetical protein
MPDFFITFNFKQKSHKIFSFKVKIIVIIMTTNYLKARVKTILEAPCVSNRGDWGKTAHRTKWYSVQITHSLLFTFNVLVAVEALYVYACVCYFADLSQNIGELCKIFLFWQCRF